MRNNFEHYDERLDRWWAKSSKHNYIDGIVGSPSAASAPDPIDMFRFFDPATLRMEFWGESFDVQALITEVQRIIPKLREEASKPHWEPRPKRP